jgi:predicted TPR repeat methyltransferase
MARRLVGVDLSPAMLAEAKKRALYDELINAEVVSMLRGRKDEFDLIVAGDVLIYVGDLVDFMPAAAAALRSGGILACSIETYDGNGFILHNEERFAHSIQYMRDMAAMSGLKEISATAVPIRRNANVDVPGYIVLLGKS